MSQTTKACRGCGRPIPPKTGTRMGYCSVECGASAAVDAASQMRAKRGPYYDRWVQSMRRVHGPRWNPGG